MVLKPAALRLAAADSSTPEKISSGTLIVPG